MINIDIELNTAVNVDGVETKQLKMREPLVRDQLAAEKANGTQSEQEVGLIANLCEVAPTVIQALTLKDYKKLAGVLAGFLD